MRPPASESTAPPVVAPERMSRGELDEWVAQELLNPEKASSGSGTIRTRTGTGGPSEKQRVLGVAALCALLLIGVLGVGGLLLTGGGGGNGGGGSKEPEVTGPFDIKPAVMTASPGKPDAIPGYKQVWDLNVGGQSVAVTRYAVVSAKDRELAITNPANGAPITTVKAYGQVKALLSGKVVGADGALTKVLAWQYEDTLNVQALEGAPLPKSVQVNLPKGATVSARLDGILITDPSASGKVGILVSRPGKKGQFGVDVRWLDAPSSSTTNSGAEQANNGSTREVAASNQRRWAYAATPAGDVWWLNADGTASFPGTEATVLTVGQPKEGTSFAGWLGEGFGPTPDPSRQVTADVLVGVWRDPVDGTLILATYLAKDAAAEDEVEPVAAVAIQSGVADDGTTGTTSSHIGIGTWLIDAATGQIAASGTRNGMRVAGVYGAVAEIADSDGDLRFVTQPMLADAAKQAQALAEQQGDKSTRPSPSQSEVGPTSTPDATGVVYQAAATDGPSSETSPSASAKNDDGLVDLPVPLLPFDILGATADGTLIVSSGNRVLALRPTGSGS